MLLHAAHTTRRLALCASGLAVALGLSACDGWRTPELSEAEVLIALQDHVQERNPVCQAFFAQWPVQVTDYERRNRSYHAQRISAMFEAGLVDFSIGKILPSSVQKPTERDYIPVKSYHLTPAGLFAYRGSTAEDGRLCYAQKKIDRIVQIEPVVRGAGQREYASRVRFVYRLDDVQNWAHHEAMQEVFPTIGRELKGSGQETELQLVQRKGRWVVDPIALL